MHVIASREMKRNGIPIEKYIAVNWLNEVDIKNIGPDVAKGLKRGTNVAGGSNQPLVQQIIKELYDKGKGSVTASLPRTSITTLVLRSTRSHSKAPALRSRIAVGR